MTLVSDVIPFVNDMAKNHVRVIIVILVPRNEI